MALDIAMVAIVIIVVVATELDIVMTKTVVMIGAVIIVLGAAMELDTTMALAVAMTMNTDIVCHAPVLALVVDIFMAIVWILVHTCLLASFACVYAQSLLAIQRVRGKFCNYY